MSNQIIAEAEGESSRGATLSDEALEQVLKEYETSLFIPQNKRSPQILLCPVGLVGSGKTTVVKMLSERLELVRISTDEIRERLKVGGFNYLRTREIAIRLADKYLKRGFSVAIDADCAGAAGEYIYEKEKTFSGKVIWIHIKTPEATILERLRHRPLTSIFESAEQAIGDYLRRKPLHEKLEMPFLYTFEPAKGELVQQIDETVRLIEEIC